MVFTGTKPGTKFIFSQEGDIRPQHKPADIIFVLVEKPHLDFVRSGNDLHHVLHFSVDQLLSGHDHLDAYVNLMNGRRLHINLRNCSLKRNQRFTVSGKGLPSKDGYGDLFIHVEVDLPLHVRKINLKRGVFPFGFNL
jgi:DnaJ-class molecular chaperone